MKKAIYLLLGLLMCSACSPVDQAFRPDIADIQLSSSGPIRICTYTQGQYQALQSTATLKQMFQPLPASDIDEIKFLQIEGKHYIEALYPNGSRYIELIPSDNDNSLLLTSRMIGCASGGTCKSCRYTGGTSCGCANGTDDCSYEQMTVIW